MMTRPISRIAIELEDATNAERSAANLRRGLQKELDAALVAAAEADPHPWLGRQVQRKCRHGYRRGQTINRKGTLTIFDPAKHRGLREIYWAVGNGAGRLFVLSKSGDTGLKFEVGKLSEGETDWALLS